MICGGPDLRRGRKSRVFSECTKASWPTAGTCRDYHKDSFGWLVHTHHHCFKEGIQDNTEFLEKWEEEGKKEGKKQQIFLTYWNPKLFPQKMWLVTIIWKIIFAICLLVIPWNERAGFRPVGLFSCTGTVKSFHLAAEYFLKTLTFSVLESYIR